MFKWTSSSWCEDQDFYRFSGIFRSVWLYAIPEVHLEDLSVRTLFEGDDFSHADLDVKLTASGAGTAVLTLKDGDQAPVHRDGGVEGGRLPAPPGGSAQTLER